MSCRSVFILATGLLLGSFDPARIDSFAADAPVQEYRPRLVVESGHGGTVTSAAFSPDGRYVLTGSWDNTARLWDATTGEEIHKLEGHTGWVTCVAFSPDGRRLLTGSYDNTARLWDTITGKEVCKFEGHSILIDAIAFSSDGRLVLTGSSDGTARLWDAATGKEIRRFEAHTGSVTSVAISPDGRQILTGHGDNTARLWDAATGEELSKLEGHTFLPSYVGFLPDGGQLLTGSRGWDNTLRFWEASTGREIRKFVIEGEGGELRVSFCADGQQILVTGANKAALLETATGKTVRNFQSEVVAFSPDGHELLTMSENVAALLDAATEKEILRFGGRSSAVTSVAFSPDGRRLLTSGRSTASPPDGYCWDTDRAAWLWEPGTGQEVRLLEGHSSTVDSVAFSPDGRRVLTAAWDGIVRVWDTDTGEQMRKMESYMLAHCVAFSPDGRHILTEGDDQTALVWDVATGKEIRKFKGHSKEVVSVAFSPDGRQVLTGSRDNTARLWDVATGKEVRKFDGSIGFGDYVFSVAFSPDGRQLLTGSRGKTARLWDAATGEQIREFTGHSKTVTSVAYSPDGRQILTGSRDNTARLWEAATGKEIREFRGHTNWLNSVAFSSDGRQVLTGSGDNTARLWDALTGEEIHKFEGHSQPVKSVALSPDGGRALTGSLDHTARLWDTATGEQIQELEGLSGRVYSVDFSRDGRLLLVGGFDRLASTGGFDAVTRLWDAATGEEIRKLGGCTGTFSLDGRQVLTGSTDQTARLWNAETGEKIRDFEGHVDSVLSAAFSPDGRRVLTCSWDGTARLWDVATGEEMHKLEATGPDVPSFFDLSCAALSPDGRQVLAGSVDGTVRLWDVATGKVMCRLQGHSGGVLSVTFSPDGRQALTGSLDYSARLWDLTSGKEIRAFRGHANWVNSVAFSPDGRLVLTGSSDSTTRLWDAQTGRQLCMLVCFHDYSWAVIDPDGRFDASNGGDVDGLHWIVGNEPIALEQLKERYYEPGLLAKIMGFNKEPLRDVSAFTAPKLYPAVTLTPPTNGNPRLGISLANRGGGIGRVIVKINGKELSADARGPGHDSQASQVHLQVALPPDHPLLIPGEENVIEVQAFNAEGYLCSRGLEHIYEPPTGPVAEPPHVWAVVAGVSDYRGDAVDLRFAAKDADDLAKALRIAAGRLFGAEKVHLTLLTTSESDPARQPTRDNLARALQRARQAKSTDVLVIYLAGHGVNYGGQDGDFYFLGSEAQSADLDDPAVRQHVALSSLELTDLINGVPANKQVLILDTCASGKLIEKLTEKRNVPSSQIRALERLKDRTGIHVLAGCAADAVSYEATRYTQGVLTYSLLLGMRGAALREEQFVDVSRLFSFAADQVPELARGIGGIQRPVIASPKGGASFDIGRLTGEDRDQIPLQPTRPLVLRASFQEETTFDDVLGLAKRVDERLRDLSARGHQATLVFVDARELPDSFRLVGRYRIQEGRVDVDVRLFKRSELAGEFSVTGEEDAADELASKIVREVERRLGGEG